MNIEHFSEEELRIIPHFSSYLVSDSGRIFSTKWNKLKELKTFLCKWGYLRAGMYGDDGKHHIVTIHLLVLSAFVGEKPCKKMLGLHINDNKLDNNVNNLKWGTFQDNMSDRVRNERQTRGEKVWTAKLTNEEVREIRDMHKIMGYRKIAKLYGIKSNTVMYCVKHISWKSVK